MRYEIEKFYFSPDDATEPKIAMAWALEEVYGLSPYDAHPFHLVRSWRDKDGWLVVEVKVTC